ncbi:ras-related protein Rab-32-like protein [Sarcoptes scabiei]|uniref:Ras-related protein Rab n=1 Tax=Sarcoptes scabiei TaxID=52283 RepID=A0A132AIU8_SARSC|nr:ras-related protein Rab-32-like protein [Sarcoptes scabiei]
MFQSTSYNESNENWSNNVIDLNRCNDRNNNNKNNNGNNNYQNCRNQSKSHQQSFSENNRIQKSQLSGSNFIETSTPTPLPSASSSKSTMITLAKTTTVPTRTNSLMSGTPSQTISKQSTRIMPEVREYLFKILVIGELGTGKTSFIKRFVHQYFSQYYRATIGVDFALKVLNWNDEIVLRLQLWDIAGQERFGNMTRIYYKEAVGAFLVFDVTAPSSFNAVLKWKHDLDSKICMADDRVNGCVRPRERRKSHPKSIDLIFFTLSFFSRFNRKCDSTKEGIASDPETLDRFCKENNFCGWFYTSAKNNINIDKAANFLVSKLHSQLVLEKN